MRHLLAAADTQLQRINLNVNPLNFGVNVIVIFRINARDFDPFGNLWTFNIFILRIGMFHLASSVMVQTFHGLDVAVRDVILTAHFDWLLNDAKKVYIQVKT